MDKPFERRRHLEDGEISQPVRTRFGIHLIRLEGRREKSFEQVKDQLKDQLTRERFTTKAKDKLEQLCGTKVVAPGEGAAVSAAQGQTRHGPPFPGPGLHGERPAIEQIVHSIEPLIEDSVPRTGARHRRYLNRTGPPPAEPSPAPATPGRIPGRCFCSRGCSHRSDRTGGTGHTARPPDPPCPGNTPGRKAGEPSRWRLLLSSSSRLWAGDSC